MHDFDFLHGSWTVANRRLAKPLTGSDEWYELSATATCWPLFGGAANVDEISFPEHGWRGLTLRLYDPERAEWTIYWANSRDGRLQAPVAGGFDGPVGDFYGDDEHEGVPIRVRYRWTVLGADSARWEQAFSTDGEQTWETNWIMQLTRA